MKRAAIRAVIFDLYGVLALNGWQAFKAKHFSDREDIWHQVYLLGKRVDAGLAEYSELVRFTAKQSGESESAVRYQLEHCTANVELLAYIESTLHGRYKLGILTNGGSQQVLDSVLPGRRAMFDAAVFSRQEGIVKPQSGIYQITADRLGVQPGECVFIDDQMPHVQGAQSAGMEAVVYTDTPSLRQELSRLL